MVCFVELIMVVVSVFVIIVFVCVIGEYGVFGLYM